MKERPDVRVCLRARKKTMSDERARCPRVVSPRAYARERAQRDAVTQRVRKRDPMPLRTEEKSSTSKEARAKINANAKSATRARARKRARSNDERSERGVHDAKSACASECAHANASVAILRERSLSLS